MSVIHLRRQGVGSMLNGTFNPCQHGHPWHLEMHETSATLCYPNCEECQGRKRGQIAKTWQENSRETLKAKIEKHVGMKFSPNVEAYMYYGADTLRIWPHVASDVYLACATYEPGMDTIRHEPTNICLVAFGSEHLFDMDAANKPWRAICQKAHEEYLKPHNQRGGERDAKGWMAWLISEWIREAGGKPVLKKSIIREEVKAPA